jgi:hypothetical protein
MSLITINLTITASPNSPRIPLKVEEKTTPSDLRKNVATATSIPLPNLRLIFRGRMIKDDDSITDVIEEYKLENESVLHCMGKPEKKEAAAPAAPTSPVAAPAAGSTVSVKPSAATTATTPTASSNLQQALTTLRSSNPPSAYLTAVTTLQKILTNIISHPLEEKYRSIKKSNASFHKRLGGVHGGGDAIMQACGFEIVNTDQGETSYSLQATPSAWNQLLETKKQVDAAVVEAQMMQNSGVAAPAAAAAPMMPPAAGAAPMPGFGASMPPMPPGGLTPDMQRAAAEMMSNPAAMQQMLQVRFVVEDVSRLDFSKDIRHSFVNMRTSFSLRIPPCDKCWNRILDSPIIPCFDNLWMHSRRIHKCCNKCLK